MVLLLLVPMIIGWARTAYKYNYTNESSIPNSIPVKLNRLLYRFTAVKVLKHVCT